MYICDILQELYEKKFSDRSKTSIETNRYGRHTKRRIVKISFHIIVQ